MRRLLVVDDASRKTLRLPCAGKTGERAPVWSFCRSMKPKLQSIARHRFIISGIVKITRQRHPCKSANCIVWTRSLSMKPVFAETRGVRNYFYLWPESVIPSRIAPKIVSQYILAHHPSCPFPSSPFAASAYNVYSNTLSKLSAGT